MKKTLLLIAALATLASAMAKPVEPTTASRIASHWLQAVTGKTYDNLTDITAQTPFHEFYVFTLRAEGGFILIAADDCVLPVLGYSETSTFPVRDMPAHVKDWMDVYEEQIAFYRERYGELDHGGSPEVRKQWDNLENGVAPLPPMATAVSPLVTTQWNQSPYYNNLCPYDNTYNERTVTGCVATAAAQIMKFWSHPATGYGSHSYTLSTYGTQSANFGATTYNWSSMPTSLSSSSSTAQVNAVATLMYHIGVAVEMDYGPGATGGSAAFTGSRNLNTPAANNAFVNYFKYKPTLHYELKADYTEAQWSAMLQADLNSGHPILYSGRDPSGGHAFVCDGYNNQGQFHFNWGWGGYYDGYYTMGDLHPGTGGTGGNSTYTFNLSNSAILGIEPMTNWSASATTTVNASSANTSYGSVSGSGTYNFADTITIRASANTGCRFYQWSDGSVQNPRTLLATGGAINVTANIGPLSGDTLGYCSNGRQSSLGNGSGNCYWGIKMPGSVVTSGHVLTAVEYYLSDSGTYDLTIYTGTTSPTTAVHTQSFTLTDEEAWNTMTLSSPVTIPSDQNFWITLHDNGVAYPCSYSFSSGNADGVLWGSSFGSIMNSGWDIAFMIRGIFTDSGSTPDPGPGSDTSGCNIVLTVGDTTSTSTAHNPIHNYYRYSLSETIIDAAELQGLGQITSISYRYSHSSASTKKTDVSIWIQPTTKTTFSSNSDLELLDANTAVLVYSGALNCTQGWNEFQFTTPYNYDGTSNLMIIIDDNSNDYDGNAYKFNTAASSGYKTLVWYSDSQNPDPTNNTYSGSKQYYQERVQMRLKGCEPQLDECTIVLPYTETFEEGSATLDCWTTDGPGNWTIGTGDHTASTGAYEGNGNAKITHGTTGNVTKFISPVLHSVTSGLQLTFAHIQRSWGGDIDNLAIYYRASSDAAWQQVANYTDAVPTWTVETVTIPGTIYQIAFEYTDHYGYGVGIDNVVFNAAPSCLAPTALTASDITADGATLTWTGDAASYNVYAVADGATTLLQNVTATTITLTGLNAMTQYTYGVRSVCGTNESEMATVSFTTACTAVTLPFTETFEVNSATLDCWTTDGPGTWQFGSDANTGATYEGAHYALIRHATSGNVTKLISPVINASSNATGLQLTFAHIQKVWGSDQDELRVYYRTSASDSWVMAAEYTNDIQTWTVENVMIPANTYQVAFEMTDSYGYGVAVDSVVFTEITASYCYPPAGLTASNITTDGATLTWTGDAASYNVYAVADGATTLLQNVTATTITLTGLNAMTQYTYGVRSVCGTNESDMVTVSFTTACTAVTLPYTETFEATSAAAGCWTTDGPGTWQFGSYTSTGDTYEGSNYAYIRHASNGNVTKLISPVINASANATVLQLTYAHIQKEWGGDQDELRVYYRTSASDSWVMVAEYTNNIQSWTVENVMIPTNTYQVAFEMTDGYGYGVAVDSVVVTEMTTSYCYPVSAVTVDNVSATGATISWTDDNNSGATYSIIGADGSVVASGLTAATYTFSGLTASTAYTFAVVTNCTADNASDPTLVTFTTDCAGGSCTVKIYATDGYGDGWNNSVLTLNQNGATVATYNMASQSQYNTPIYDTFQVSVCSGIPVSFSWTSGSTYDYEAGFQILDGNDTVLYTVTDASTLTDGAVFYTVADACGNHTPTPPALDSMKVTVAVNDVTMGTTVPAPGVHYFYEGDTCSVIAVPNTGYHLQGWGLYVTYNGTTDLDTTVTTTATDVFDLFGGLVVAHGYGSYEWTVTAIFAADPTEPDTLAVTFAVNNAAMGTTTPAPGTYNYPEGDTVYFSATPNSGYRFVGWAIAAGTDADTLDASYISAYFPASIFMAYGSVTMTALFEAEPTVPDTLFVTFAVDNPTMGTTLPAPGTYQYFAGDTVHFGSQATAGYRFLMWEITVGNEIDTFDASYANGYFILADVLMGESPVIFKAFFEPGTPDSTTITYAVNDASMGTTTPASGTYTIYVGDSIAATAIPAAGYSLSNWTLDVVVSGTVVNSYTSTDNPVFFGYVPQNFADYNASMILTANFVADSVVPEPDSLILITAVNNPTMGTILPAPGSHVLYAGDTFSVRAVPNAGYHVESWHIVYSYGPYTIQDTVINLGLEEFFSLDTADYYLGMTMSFTANFAAGDAPVMHDSVTVITSVNDPTMGTITPAPGTHYYVEGDTVEFGIQPNPGYYIYALHLTATHPLIGVLADETLTDTSEIAEYIAEMAAEPLIVDAEMYGLTVSINVLFAAEGTTPNEYTVTVNYNATMGNVLSNGEPVANGTNITVIEGSSITFTANANNNYRFVAWVDNGDTIEGAQTVYTISNIDADHSVTAVFEAVQGIDDVDMDNVNIYSVDNMIVVRGAEGKQVVLFDVNGRMLSRKASATEHVEFRVDNSGIYLVKVANAAAKRVVVVR